MFISCGFISSDLLIREKILCVGQARLRPFSLIGPLVPSKPKSTTDGELIRYVTVERKTNVI